LTLAGSSIGFGSGGGGGRGGSTNQSNQNLEVCRNVQKEEHASWNQTHQDEESCQRGSLCVAAFEEMPVKIAIRLRSQNQMDIKAHKLTSISDAKKNASSS
jgi:hypothetical protein